MKNMRIAERIFNRPLMLHEGQLNTIERVFSQRIGLTLLGAPPAEIAKVEEDQRRKYGYRVVNGLGIIEIFGPLMHRALEMEFPSGGPTTYADVLRAFDMALADDEVLGVVGLFGTGGGEVSGAFDTADHIFNSRGIKPLTAIVDEEAYSAGYLLASAFDRIVVPRTGGVGSIGVIATHTEFSRWEEENGITVKHIYAGARKADFSPHTPLSAEAEASLQEKVDDTNLLFLETVARNRGMKVRDVEDMQAATFEGKKAVAKKLADEVSAVDKAIAAASKGRAAKLIAASHSAAATKKETGTMTIEELREQHPELAAQIEAAARRGMIAQAEADTARTEAVSEATTRVLGVAHALFGEAAGNKLTQVVNTGLTSEQVQELGIALAPAGNGTEQQMLDAITNAAAKGVGGTVVKPGEESERKTAAAAIAAGGSR